MQKIEITTTQKVAIEYELATWGERISAFVIDQVIIFSAILLFSSLLGVALGSNAVWAFMLFYAVIMLVTYILVTGKDIRRISPFFIGGVCAFLLVALLFVSFVDGMKETEMLYTLFLLPIYLFYSLALESIMDGQTIGKRTMGIKVVKLTGSEPILNDYLIRWTFRMLDIWGSLGMIASLLIGSSPKRQRLGDIIANTTVIRIRSSMNLNFEDINRIKSLDNYEVSYPGVRQFSEKDMLLIKTALNRFNRYPNEAHRAALNEVLRIVIEKLQIQKRPAKPLQFLKTVINDYIVLTR